MAVLVGWDPTPTPPGDPAATHPTDDTLSLPVTAPTAAAPAPAVPAPVPATTTPRDTAGRAVAPQVATPGGRASAARAPGGRSVAPESRVGVAGGRAGAPGTFVASDGRTVAWVSGARGALALVPAAPEQTRDTEPGPAPGGAPGSGGSPDRVPAPGSGGVPAYGPAGVPGRVSEPSRVSRQGLDILPGVGFQAVPGVAFDPGPGVLPAAPRPQRRPARDRRPVDPAPAPARRPAVAACEETYARRRFVALLAVAVASAAAVIGLGLLAASTGDDGVPDRTAITEVRGGETLWDIASRVAPDSPRQAVVDRIRLLNGMQGSTLHPGQPLVVPTAG